jgi:hypothetical protein
VITDLADDLAKPQPAIVPVVAQERGDSSQRSV